MKFLFIGLGGVGGYLAAELINAKHSVDAIFTGEHGKAIAQKGLTIRGVVDQHVHAIGSFTEDSSSYDVIVLGTKTQNLQEAIKPVRHLRPHVWLTLQNGVEAESIVESNIHPISLVGGIAYIDARIVEPGVIEVLSPGKFSFSNNEGLQTIFSQAGISARWVDDIRPLKWQKLAWNSLFNPLCCLTRKTVGQVRSDTSLQRLAKGIFDELVCVAQSEGVEVDVSLLNRFFSSQDGVTSGNPHSRTSMWADLSRGKKTEIDYLNGSVVRLGEKHRIPTPYNIAITELVHSLENPDSPSK